MSQRPNKKLSRGPNPTTRPCIPIFTPSKVQSAYHANSASRANTQYTSAVEIRPGHIHGKFNIKSRTVIDSAKTTSTRVATSPAYDSTALARSPTTRPSTPSSASTQYSSFVRLISTRYTFTSTADWSAAGSRSTAAARTTCRACAYWFLGSKAEADRVSMACERSALGEMREDSWSDHGPCRLADPFFP